jgi:methionyl aminopeptidase
MSTTDILEAEYRTGQIKIHDAEAFEGMRKAGRLAAECLDMLAPLVVPGAVTDDIDKAAREFILDHDALPACLVYRGFGNIDVTVIVDGWHGDTSRMYGVGAVSPRAKRLVDITYEAIARGIAAAKPGARTGDIGHAIQSYVESMRCSVVRDFCGHGVGLLFHDAPNILHYGSANEGVEMREGMIFTIEPMINLGRPHVKVLADGWTAVTRDRSLSAQYEHTVGVTADGCEIFTLSAKGLDRPGLPS